MSDLFSKVLAGGVSAALFLFWWPTVVPGSGAEWLLVRGLAWALAFEVLFLAFCPLERALTGAVKSRTVRGVRRRHAARALVLAAAGVAIPLVLINGVQPKPKVAHAAAPKERVVVERRIVRREVVVKRVNKIVPVPGQTVTTTVSTPAPVSPGASNTTKTTATSSRASTRRAASTPAAKTGTTQP